MKPANSPELADTNTVLFQVLDFEMLKGFSALQERTDPHEGWYYWDDNARTLWWEWCQEAEQLTQLDRLKIALWKELHDANPRF